MKSTQEILREVQRRAHQGGNRHCVIGIRDMLDEWLKEQSVPPGEDAVAMTDRFPRPEDASEYGEILAWNTVTQTWDEMLWHHFDHPLDLPQRKAAKAATWTHWKEWTP